MAVTVSTEWKETGEIDYVELVFIWSSLCVQCLKFSLCFPVYTVTCTSSEVTTALSDAELSCSQQKTADEKDEEEKRRTVRSDRQRKELREAEVFMKKVLWNTASICGLEKNGKLRRQTRAGSHTFIAFHLILCVLFSWKPQKSPALLLSYQPSFFLHPTTLPLHPRSASHSALILLFSRCLSSLTRVNDCCPLLLFPQPRLCVSSVSRRQCSHLFKFVRAFVHIWMYARLDSMCACDGVIDEELL